MKKVITGLFLLLFLGISGYFLYNVHILNIFSLKYIVIIYILLFFVLGIQLLSLIRKKNRWWVYFFANLLTILVSAMMVFVALKLNDTYRFLQSNTNASFETNYYYLISTKKELHLEEANKKGVYSFADDDIVYKEAIKQLNESGITNIVNSLDIVNLLSDYLKGTVEYLLISNNRYDMLCEESELFAEMSTVLKKIEIQIKVETEIPNDTTTSTAVKDVTKEPFVVYISGIDTRGPISTRSRSDVNILMAVNPKTKEILMVHIPRDFYVPLHGKTGLKDKLTHSGIYGINMSIETIEDLMNVDISYYFRVNFNTLEILVDTIGGITIDSDTAFTAWTNRTCSFQVGQNPVNGMCALAFARERHAYASGDRHRGENQEHVISKLIEKFSNGKTLISNYSSILNALNGHFQTNMTTNDITSLIKMQIDDMASWNISSVNVDGSGASDYTYSMPSQKLYVMVPNMTTVNYATKRINEVLAR